VEENSEAFLKLKIYICSLSVISAVDCNGYFYDFLILQKFCGNISYVKPEALNNIPFLCRLSLSDVLEVVAAP
jgi:hypothetical protein